MHAKLLQSCPTQSHPLDIACQAPLSIGFSRQEYWSGLPCPPPGDLPDSGVKPASLASPALAGKLFTTSVIREAPERSSMSLKKTSCNTSDKVTKKEDVLGSQRAGMTETTRTQYKENIPKKGKVIFLSSFFNFDSYRKHMIF